MGERSHSYGGDPAGKASLCRVAELCWASATTDDRWVGVRIWHERVVGLDRTSKSARASWCKVLWGADEIGFPLRRRREAGGEVWVVPLAPPQAVDACAAAYRAGRASRRLGDLVARLFAAIPYLRISGAPSVAGLEFALATMAEEGGNCLVIGGADGDEVEWRDEGIALRCGGEVEYDERQLDWTGIVACAAAPRGRQGNPLQV